MKGIYLIYAKSAKNLVWSTSNRLNWKELDFTYLELVLKDSSLNYQQAAIVSLPHDWAPPSLVH